MTFSFVKQRGFSLLLFSCCALLFAFQTWLAWPGFMHDDSPHSVLLVKDNWHPIILTYVLEKLYKTFGVHIYYMLFFNLIPFYLGLFIFSYAFYKKFRSLWAFAVLGITGIGNIFFQNFIMHSSTISPMVIFLLYALIFYAILNPIKSPLKRILFWGFCGCVFLFSLLTRHNACVQIGPLIFVGLAYFNQKHPLSLIKNILLLFLGMILIIGWSFGIPKTLQRVPSYPTQHIFLHQIAGACIPADDATCFKEEWYQPGASFETVKEEYRNWPFFADRFSTLQPQYHVFQRGKLKDLSYYWGKAIIKHPGYYLQHIFRFLVRMWFMPISIESGSFIQRPITNTFFNHWLQISPFSFPEQEKQITFTPKKIQFYATLRDIFPMIPTIIWITILWGCFSLSVFYLKHFRTNILLWYIFATASGGIAGSILFTIFSPVDYYRYIHPICVSALATLLGTVAYIIKKREQPIHVPLFIKGIFILTICFVLHAAYRDFFYPLARIDFEAAKQESPPFEIYVPSAPETSGEKGTPLTWIPWWMDTHGIYGRVFETSGNHAQLTIDILSPCEIRIFLRGTDSSDSKNRRFNEKVTYTSVKINGNEILTDPATVSHDFPFVYVLQGEPGLVKLETSWQKGLE